MVIVSSRVMLSLTTYCIDSLPNEACGVLLGTVQPETVEVTAIQPLPNASNEPRISFRFDPELWINTLLESRCEGLDVVGVFHSHPGEPAVPSKADLMSAAVFPTYWIVSLVQQHQPAVKAYKIKKAPHSSATTENAEYEEQKILINNS